METSSTVVIKVKYGDMLRRFNASVVDDKLLLRMDGLREKILSLFTFASGTDMMLTYVDEDGDVVSLIDDDDLHDVVKQGINPVRITVQVNNENSGNQSHSSASSTPVSLPHGDRLPNLNAGLAEIMRNIPEPLRQSVLKLSADLVAKASSTSPPVISELVDSFSKFSSSYLGQPLDSAVMSNMQNGVPKSSTPTGNEDSEPLKAAATLEKLKTDSSMERSGVKIQNATATRKEGPTFDFNAVAAALESQNVDISKPKPICVSHTFGKREKAKKNVECSNVKWHARSNNPLAAVNNVEKIADSNHLSLVDNKLTGKEIGSSSVPKLASSPCDGSSDLVNGDKATDSMKPNLIDAFKKETTSTWSAFKGVGCGPTAMYECPFSGTPLENISAAAPHSASDSVPFSRSNSQNGNNGSTFHWGVCCDGCNIHPIVGPRFKSKVMVDYDLCSLCFDKMGNGNDYVRMDRPTTMYECPFSGKPLEKISAATAPQSASDAVPFSRSNNQNDNNGSAFHWGVSCDGCNINPIVGPRFKSKVMLDYDLCSLCFDKMGKRNEYFRMDRPPVYLHCMPRFRVGDQGEMVPHVYRGSKVKLGAAKLDSRFIQDVNIFDGTVMEPLVPFTKIWRMRNNGTVAWSKKTQLVWIGGDKLSDVNSIEVQIPDAGLQIDQELDVAINLISPELPGRYISYWRMAAASGQKFGQRVWVLIQVEPSTVKESPRHVVRNLNLNLPPVSCPSLEIINVNPDPEPVPELSPPKAHNSKKIAYWELPNTENELKFPINDSLLVGNGAGSSSAPPSDSSPSLYPNIDFSEVVQSLPSSSASPALPVPISPPPAVTESVDPQEKYLMEGRLLMELEEMGFKEVDLNKEVLRMNEYDLERSVDDLCGVAEWDPILEELQEMGFHDSEMNKKLLKKNKGSIKRVVMDLIAGEGEED